MPVIVHGPVSLTLPESLTPPANAGNMSADQILRTPKAPHGVGLACQLAASACEDAGPKFNLPSDVTPETLRAAAERADSIDAYIYGIRAVLAVLEQSNLLFDAAAWEQLRKVNDQVKAQGKFQPELLVIFKPVLDFFARGSRSE